MTTTRTPEEVEALDQADYMLGRAFRQVLVASIDIGHTTLVSTLRDYYHPKVPAENGVDMVQWILREAILGKSATVEERYPELVAAWRQDWMADKMLPWTPKNAPPSTGEPEEDEAMGTAGDFSGS